MSKSIFISKVRISLNKPLCGTNYNGCSMTLVEKRWNNALIFGSDLYETSKNL